MNDPDSIFTRDILSLPIAVVDVESTGLSPEKDRIIEIDGEKVLVTGPDIEAVGQTAGSIEQLTTIKDKDPRVFQDGIYITKKPVRGEA